MVALDWGTVTARVTVTILSVTADHFIDKVVRQPHRSRQFCARRQKGVGQMKAPAARNLAICKSMQEISDTGRIANVP